MVRTSSQSERPIKKLRLVTEPTKQLAGRRHDPEKSAAKSDLGEGARTTKSKGKGKAKETDQVAAIDNEPSSADPPSTFKIVAGSYEKLLYGLEGKTSYSDEDKLKFHLKPIFAFPAHVSCIKAVAASPHGGKWLATGSADEIIKVWDLRRRKEIGGLMHHEGSITHLLFPSRSHLFSASEDGTLCLFRARDWAVLRALKGHKGRVNSMAVHPSGKVALSVGKDKALRMWDLLRGRGVASTKLGKEGETVRWSVDGNVFAVQSGSTIEIYNTEMSPLHTIHHPSRIHDLKFCKREIGEGEVLLVGAEDKKLSVYEIFDDSTKPPAIVAQMVGHENRVKAIETLRIALPPESGRTSTTIISTVSSDGKIHVYDLYSLLATSPTVSEISPVAIYDTKGTRLTCITLADGDAGNHKENGKRKRDDSQENATSDDDDDEYESTVSDQENHGEEEVVEAEDD